MTFINNYAFLWISQVEVRQSPPPHTQEEVLQATPLVAGGHINSNPPIRAPQMELELQLPPTLHDCQTRPTSHYFFIVKFLSLLWNVLYSYI